MLSSRVFGAVLCPLHEPVLQVAQFNIFEQGSLHAMHEWKPRSWNIPEEEELSELEVLICQPGDSDTQLPATEYGTYYFPELGAQHKGQNIKWFFSATAIAINSRKPSSDWTYPIELRRSLH
jgi:hypothetical protein